MVHKIELDRHERMEIHMGHTVRKVGDGGHVVDIRRKDTDV